MVQERIPKGKVLERQTRRTWRTGVWEEWGRLGGAHCYTDGMMLLMVDDPAVHFPIEHPVSLVFDVGDLPDVAAAVPTDADVVVDHCSLQ